MQIRIAASALAGFAALALTMPGGAPATASTGGSHAVCGAATTAAALARPVFVDRPPIAAAEGLTGSTVVRVDVASDGTARNASVLQSSGWTVLDRAALRTLLAARYNPEMLDCKSVSGSYRVLVEFVS